MRRARATRRAVLVAPLGALLAGCGFHPLYAPGAGGAMGPVQDDLAAVSVNLIPERSGQLLRQALQERLERGGAGIERRYDLAVAYGLNGEGIGVQPDSSVTRFRISAIAIWTLLSRGLRPTTLSSGTARAIDGFDIINEQFFAVDMNNDALTRRLADSIADQVTLQVAAYFRRQPTIG